VVTVYTTYFIVIELCVLPRECMHVFRMILTTNSIKWLLVVMEMAYASCEVRTESLNILQMDFDCSKHVHV
jgi:hypothetical protein